MVDEPPAIGLPPAALRLRRLGWGIAALVVGVLALVLDIGVRFNDRDPVLPPLVGPVVLGVAVAGFGWIWSALVHRSWSYRLSPDRLRVEWGVITQHVALLPRSRVQHVSTHHGPLQRSLGLTSITVHTAGARTPNVEIPDLLSTDAEGLRAELLGTFDDG